MAQDPPDDFDWVAAQTTCNAASMFDRLSRSVKVDVERRTRLSGRNESWKFEVEDGDGQFEVLRGVASTFSSSKIAALVRFEREGRRIHVHGEDVDVDFTAVVTLDTAGVCRFVVGEVMYSEWEIRRMALEQLFFEEPEEPE